MSRIDSLLEIIIAVKDQGLGNLSKYQNALKQILTAEQKLQQEYGDTEKQLDALNAMERKFIATLKNEARQTLESLKVEKTRAQVLKEQRDRQRAAILQEAELLRQKGRLTEAENRLRHAMSLTVKESAEYRRIQQRIARVEQDRVARLQRQQNELVQSALAQAKLARATGNTSREIAILTRATQRSNLSEQNRLRLNTALAQAERRKARELERAREAMRRQRAEANLLNRTISGLRQGFAFFTRALASFVLIGFTLRTAFRFIGRTVVDPLKSVVTNTLQITDNFRQVEASLVGVVGSMRAVRDLSQDVKQAISGIPVTFLEALSATRGLAFIPSTAGLIQTPGQQRVGDISGLLRILTGLATIDPEQGIEGARFAVREALSGEVRSLRFRFEISPQVVAGAIGKSLEEVKADPQLMIQALSRFVDLFVGEEAFQEFEMLLSTQGKKFRGALQEFFKLIGDAGFYDRVVDIIKGITDTLTDAIRGGRLDKAANLVSNTLTGLIEAVAKAGGAVIGILSGGQRADLLNFKEQDAEAVASAFAKITESLGVMAIALAQSTPRIVGNIAALLDSLGFGIGPVARTDIESRLNELRMLRIGDITERGRILTTFQGGVQGTHAESVVAFLTQRIEDRSSEIKRLEERLSIFDRFSTLGGAAPGGGRTPGTMATEMGKALALLPNRLGQALPGDSIESIALVPDLATQLIGTTAKLFDVNEPGSIAAVLDDANKQIAMLGRAAGMAPTEVGRVGLIQAAQTMRMQRRATNVGLQNQISDMLAGLIGGAPESIGQMAGGSRRQQAILDVLAVIAGTQGVNLNQPQGSTGRALGGVFQEFQARGYGVGGAFRPETLKTVSILLGDLSTQIVDQTGDVVRANDEVQRLAATFLSLANEQAAAVGPEQAERWQVFADFIREVARESKQAADEFKQAELEKSIANFLKSEADRLQAEASQLRRVVDALKQESARIQDSLFGGFALAGGAGLPATVQAGFTQSFNQITAPGGQAVAYRNRLNQQIAMFGQRLQLARLDLMSMDTTGMTDEQIQTRTEQLQKAVENLDQRLGDALELRAEFIDNIGTQARAGFSALIDSAGMFSGMAPGRAVRGLQGLFGQILGAGGYQQRLNAAGFGGTMLIEPDDVPKLIEGLNLLEQKFIELGRSEQFADEQTDDLATQLQRMLEVMADDAPEVLQDSFAQAIGLLQDFKDKVGDTQDELKQLVEATAGQISESIRAGLGDELLAVLQGRFNDIESIATQTLSAIQRQIIDLILQATLFNSGKNSLSTFITSLFTGQLGSASGNIFSGRTLIPMASGGIIDRYTAIAGANNTVFTAGESGPEGVVPLDRDLDGQLGVRMVGGGGSGAKVININMRITTPDADGFRRSGTQITRMVKGAVDRAVRV